MIDSEEYMKQRLAKMTDAERAEFEARSAAAELAMDIAQIVYDARKEAGLTQAELAKAMGVTQSRISELEGGGSVPNLATLAKVAEAVGCKISIHFDTAA